MQHRRISVFLIFKILPYIQYFWNFVCRANNNCRIQISNHFNPIPGRKFYFTQPNAWLPNQQLFTYVAYGQVCRKHVLFNFHDIFFLTFTMAAQVSQRILWGVQVYFRRYDPAKFRVFPVYVQTIILMLHDLSNVDIMLSDFLNYSILLFWLILKMI